MTLTAEQTAIRLREISECCWAGLDQPEAGKDLYAAAALITSMGKKITELRKQDAEAATHVESAICMRTNFTGDPPYVGWKGLGLAMSEAFDERDALSSQLEEAKGHIKGLLRYADAVQFTSGRGKNQAERIESARAFLKGDE